MRSMEQEFVPQWQSGTQVDDSYLGKGQMAEVRRRMFEQDGAAIDYAYKWMPDLEETERTVDVYARLREAKLPVVSFLEPIAWRDSHGTQVGIAMEDATEGGRYTIANVCRRRIVTPNYIYDGVLVDASCNPTLLKQQMVQNLAVMHNNGLYDFHPGISYFLRFDNADQGNVSPIILDYSNICYQTMPSGWPWQRGDFHAESVDDAHKLLEGLTVSAKEQQELMSLYRDVRRQGDLASSSPY